MQLGWRSESKPLARGVGGRVSWGLLLRTGGFGVGVGGALAEYDEGGFGCFEERDDLGGNEAMAGCI